MIELIFAYLREGLASPIDDDESGILINLPFFKYVRGWLNTLIYPFLINIYVIILAIRTITARPPKIDPNMIGNENFVFVFRNVCVEFMTLVMRWITDDFGILH